MGQKTRESGTENGCFDLFLMEYSNKCANLNWSLFTIYSSDHECGIQQSEMVYVITKLLIIFNGM